MGEDLVVREDQLPLTAADIRAHSSIMRKSKRHWQQQQREEFRNTNGYSTAAHYRTGGLRKLILTRDNYACVVCGITDQEHKIKWRRPITIDHADKNRKNNALDNLRTLCLKCHGRKDIKPSLIEPRLIDHKAEILKRRGSGKTYQDIADTVGFSIGAVWKWVQRWEEDGVNGK